MKNFPSKRRSRDNLAREQTCQSRVMFFASQFYLDEDIRKRRELSRRPQS
jgi:hypothetical protein